jgi:hypothetical protein
MERHGCAWTESRPRNGTLRPVARGTPGQSFPIPPPVRLVGMDHLDVVRASPQLLIAFPITCAERSGGAIPQVADLLGVGGGWHRRFSKGESEHQKGRRENSPDIPMAGQTGPGNAVPRGSTLRQSTAPLKRRSYRTRPSISRSRAKARFCTSAWLRR